MQQPLEYVVNPLEEQIPKIVFDKIFEKKEQKGIEDSFKDVLEKKVVKEKKSVPKILEDANKLGTRDAMKIGDSIVQQHLESLV